MKQVVIIGSGLSALSCAIALAEQGVCSKVVSPYTSERAQSVMAAGGINAAIEIDDSPEQHAEDTLKSGGNIAGKHDYTCCFDLQYEYYKQIESPIKEFYVFEHSAHSPIFEEPEDAAKLFEKILETE